MGRVGGHNIRGGVGDAGHHIARAPRQIVPRTRPQHAPETGVRRAIIHSTMTAIPLDDPVVQSLLDGPNLARLSYIGTDGRPRVVPIWFTHKDGDIIMVTGPKAQKVRALEANGAVAISIDSNTPPYKVLLIDGDATLENVEGMDPLYRGIVERYLGPAADGYLNALKVKRQVRIRTKVRSYRIFDFVKRRPKSLS
jgi:PPOX class probable F420-dependent enzyme